MSSVAKSIDKLKSHIEKGSEYEGQQFIKTVYHRLRSRKHMQESRVLLTEASCIQLSHDQVTSLPLTLQQLQVLFKIWTMLSVIGGAVQW